MPKILIAILLLAVCVQSALSQEGLAVDGLCMFSSDHSNEKLYIFPSDKRSVTAIENLMALVGRQLPFTAKVANVPEMAAAEKGNEKLLLYNPFAMQKYESSQAKEWQITVVIAHQIGHLENNHNLEAEPHVRKEIELEADRFAGYLLYQLGASLHDVDKAVNLLVHESAATGFPDGDSRLHAYREGWYSGRAAVGTDSYEHMNAPANQEELAIPKFPWPPPRASANAEIASSMLIRGVSRPLLGDAASRLQRALDMAGYGERSFYAIPHGFALVARVESIYPDGTPKPGDQRWPIKAEPPRVFSLMSYIRALFTSSPGLYRVIAFIVTNVPVTQAVYSGQNSLPREWAWAGANKLPTLVNFSDYTSEYSCTALIYEMIQPSAASSVVLNIPSSLTGKLHLQRSSLIQALQTEH